MSQQATKSLFCRISKVDEEKRIVTGIGASEAVDAEGEIFDYAGSKPYIEAWSEGAQQRSGGKSFGNIREMHQLSAVGKLAEPIVFDDAQRLVILTAYISDDEAWKKCLDGTYTGFSIRGPVIGDKWSDAGNPGVKRYICAPVEWSICDLPCNEEAVFTAVKAGGVTEERRFKMAAAQSKTKSVDGEELAKDDFAYRPSDNLADWKLPIRFSTTEKTESHIRNAIARWSSTEMPDANEKSLARIRLEKAAKEHGIELSKDSLKAAGAAETEPNVAKTEVQKSMYDIGDLASVICSLKWTQDGLVYEREIEGDGSPVPDKLKSSITDLCAVLVDLTREETAELVTAMKAAGATKMVAKAKTEGLDRVKKCIKALGAMDDCMTGKCDHGGIEECAKAIGAAHKKATAAMSAWADGDGAEDKDSEDNKSADKAAGAPQSQGASPENGEEEMDAAQKAQLEKAAKDSAEALEVAKANATGLQQVADALGKLTTLIAGEPVAAKSAATGTVAVVSKAEEVSSTEAKPTQGASAEEVAKSILSKPRAVSAQELSTLQIGR